MRPQTLPASPERARRAWPPSSRKRSQYKPPGAFGRAAPAGPRGTIALPMRRLMSVASVLSAALVLMSVPSSAQVRTAYPDKRGFKLSDFPRSIKLAENVYGYEEIRQ